ncbi:hypothetical protein D9M68_442290 [compost metagenome]
MQLRRAARCLRGQPVLQEAGEETVVAVPVALGVEREQQQVGALEVVEHLARVAAAGERIAQRCAELAEHAGVEQEGAAGAGLPREDVFGKELAQFQVRAGERCDKGRVVAALLQRQRGEVDRRGPALGAAVQRGDVVVAQRQAAAAAQQLGGLLQRKAQRGRRDLQQLAARTQAPQAQFRRGPGPGHQRAARWQRRDQLLQEVERGRAMQRFEIVQHDRERL